MNNERPEPRQVLLELLGMYGSQTDRLHIKKDMKRYLMSIRKDLILYGSLSEKQFHSIRKYLIYEMRGTIAQIETFFEPCIRTFKSTGRFIEKTEPKTELPNNLEKFL
jgi:hypothetical protein